MSEKDDFIKLKLFWYKKLKDQGFNDLETPQGSLKDWPAQRLRRDYTLDSFEEKQTYYQKASSFFWEHSFKDAVEKEIWRLHSEGFPFREIAKKVRTETNKMNKDKVQIIVRKLSKIALRDGYEEI